jgi:signal transduction histidine kinase
MVTESLGIDITETGVLLGCVITLLLIVVKRKHSDFTRLDIAKARDDTAHEIYMCNADTLEIKVRERTSELEAANAQLERTNQLKSDFVSVVSHELRTPLTSIKSFAEILRADLDELDKETKIHFLTIIDNEAARLTRLINDLLDLQRLDSGRMIWRDTEQDLHSLVQESIDFFSTAFAKKGITFIGNLPPEEMQCPIIIDPDKVKQILTNLLSNALKFTKQGKVTVNLDCPHSNNPADVEYKISVSDTGPGIPKEEISKIFERFHQAKNIASESAGSGLGLAICREYVEHYQGSIDVESNLNTGSAFIITLPAIRTQTKRLGEILIDAGLVTDRQIKEALEKQNSSYK